MSRIGLTYLTIASSDLEASCSFYQDVFGWTAEPAAKGVYFFKLENVTVALVDRDVFEKVTNMEPGPSGPPAALYSWNVPTRKELDDIVARAAQLQAIILRPAGKMEWGSWAAVFRAPEGTLWEIAWKPESTD